MTAVTFRSMARKVPKGGEVVVAKGVATVLDANGAAVAFPEYSADEKAFLADWWVKRRAARAAAGFVSKPQPPLIDRTGKKPIGRPVLKASPQPDHLAPAPNPAPGKQPAPGVNGWLAAASQYMSNGVQLIGCSQYLPNMPSQPTGAIFYIWSGISDSTGDYLLQPVAEWVQGATDWTLNTYYVDGSNIISNATGVNVSIEVTVTAYTAWYGTGNKFFGEFSDYSTDTLLYVTADFDWYQVECVEEVYSETNAGLPPSIGFTSIVAYDMDDNLPTSWTKSHNSVYVSALSASGNDPGSVSITNIT